MTNFTFSDEQEQVVYSCTNCPHISTERHFKSNDVPTCVFCNSEAEQFGTQKQTTGMKKHEYHSILDWLQKNRAGIGPAICSNIQERFSDGNDFLEACRDAYDNGNYEPLTEICGIGESYARDKLALGLAELKGWEDGDAEPVEADVFTFKQ